MGLGCFRSSKRKLHSRRSAAPWSASTKVCCMHIIQERKHPYRRRVLSRLAGGSWVRESRRKAPTKKLEVFRKFEAWRSHERFRCWNHWETIFRKKIEEYTRCYFVWNWCHCELMRFGSDTSHCQEIAHHCPTREASNPKIWTYYMDHFFKYKCKGEILPSYKSTNLWHSTPWIVMYLL